MHRCFVREIPANTHVHDKYVTPDHLTFGIFGDGDLLKVCGYYQIFSSRETAQRVADRENARAGEEER